MLDSTSDAVHQPILDRVLDYPLFDPDAELFPEITTLPQCFQVTSIDPFQSPLMQAPQKLHPSRDCVYVPDPRLVLDLSDSRTSIGTIPDNSRIQSVTTLWRTSAMGQCPFCEPSAPNELTVSYWSGMYEDDLVTEHAFMAPTMPQIQLLGTEVSHNKTHPMDYSLWFFSRLCVINQEFPRSPAQSHREGSKQAPQNLCPK